ncbi:hypothetical protein [Streptomyces sp. NPDC058964]|uniref:hypothetical protein n=1 Tax=Streptomyces sp. NPDC058964 TaxID=3346681 RepID=UPI0036C001F8
MLGEQAAKAVTDAGGLANQVVVESDEHLQFGDGLVLGSLSGSHLWKAFFQQGDGRGLVFALADVQAGEDSDVADVDHVRPSGRPRPAVRRHRSPPPRYEEPSGLPTSRRSCS